MEDIIKNPAPQTLINIQYNFKSFTPKQFEEFIRSKIKADLYIENTLGRFTIEKFQRYKRMAAGNNTSIVILTPTVPVLLNNNNPHFRALNLVNINLVYRDSKFFINKLTGVMLGSNPKLVNL